MGSGSNAPNTDTLEDCHALCMSYMYDNNLWTDV